MLRRVAAFLGFGFLLATSAFAQLASQTALVGTVTDSGEVIEQFATEIPVGSDESIYNIAGASMLVEWTATYGPAREVPERMIGPQRWTTSAAPGTRACQEDEPFVRSLGGRVDGA